MLFFIIFLDLVLYDSGGNLIVSHKINYMKEIKKYMKITVLIHDKLTLTTINVKTSKIKTGGDLKKKLKPSLKHT